MANFDQAMQMVFKHEGGLVDNPLDPGGITNFGITIPMLQQAGTIATPAAIRGLTQEVAATIYRVQFWDRICGDQIESQKLATVVLDQAVLRGLGTMVIVLQSLLRLTQDGLFGDKTLHALNGANTNELMLSLIFNSEYKYARIVAAKNSQAQFLEGWLSRTHDLLSYVFLT